MTYTAGRWNLDELLPSAEPAEIDKALKAIERRVKKVETWRKRLKPSLPVKDFLALLKDYEAFQRELLRLYHFVSLRLAADTQDQATLVGFEKDLVRFKTLGTKGFDTQQNIDNQQAKVDTTKASIAADVAAIETAQTQLDYTDIRAPSDGRMGVRMVDPGNVVHASDAGPIAILVQAQPAAVLFTLPADTLDDVRDAMARGPVQVLAFDRNNRAALSTGILATIDNLIDQTTATYRLKATFTNEDEKLWPGEFVNARVLLETRKNVIAVPSTVVQRGAKGLFAWVVSDDNKAVPHKIELGPVSGDLTVITAGLNDGDRVITDGQYKLQVDAPVVIIAAPKTAENAK
jgi:multidrug efflux system membrane fusion protein